MSIPINPNNGNSAAATNVLKEFNQVKQDATWLNAHKGDANIKQELATKAPEIEKNWEKFQGDAAGLQNSANGQDKITAANVDSAAAGYFDTEQGNMKEILGGALSQDLQHGDATAQGIQQQFSSTIDQGNAQLLHAQQQINQDPSVRPDIGTSTSKALTIQPYAGGTASPNSVSDTAKQIQKMNA